MGKSSSTARKPYTSRYAAYYPLYRPNSPLDDNDKDKDATTTIIGKEKSTEEREKERQELLRELSTNGYEHVQILGGVLLIQSVRDEDVRAFFEGFDVDKVRRITHL
jgi:histone-lysine N-methyltransferase SETD1